MDYTGLQTSVLNWAARSDAAVSDEVPNFIAFATDSFNHGIPANGIAPLRTREMLTNTTLTNNSGVAALPSDFLQVKDATSLASPIRPLSYMTTGYVGQAYADSAAGLSNQYTVIGNNLYAYPTNSTSIGINYYQAIPALSDDNPSNWLLAKKPDLYLHAALYHLGLFTKDNDLTQRSAALVAAGIDGLNLTDTLALYSKTGSTMGMVTP